MPSTREQVVALWLEGCRNDEIAARLELHPQICMQHLYRACDHGELAADENGRPLRRRPGPGEYGYKQTRRSASGGNSS